MNTSPVASVVRRTLVLACALALSGCGGWVNSDQWARAVELCESHGGPNYIEGKLMTPREVVVYCKDGVKIESYARAKT